MNPGDPVREIGKLLLIMGLILAAAGALLMFGGRLPGRIGRLPGDIVVKRDNFTFYFPLVTSLLASAVLTLLLWLFSRR